MFQSSGSWKERTTTTTELCTEWMTASHIRHVRPSVTYLAFELSAPTAVPSNLHDDAATRYYTCTREDEQCSNASCSSSSAAFGRRCDILILCWHRHRRDKSLLTGSCETYLLLNGQLKEVEIRGLLYYQDIVLQGSCMHSRASYSTLRLNIYHLFNFSIAFHLFTVVLIDFVWASDVLYSFHFFSTYFYSPSVLYARQIEASSYELTNGLNFWEFSWCR